MNTRKEGRGASEPDLQFLQEVLVYNEFDREHFRDYLLRNPDAIEPFQWLVDVWGAKNMRASWFGEGWDEFSEGYPGGLPPFSLIRLPIAVPTTPERRETWREFIALYPSHTAHMRILP